MKEEPKTHRRNLPHFEKGERPIHVTFCTKDGFILPESVRDVALQHCLADNGKKYLLHCVVVMPDHIHMILSLLYKPGTGATWGLAEVMNGIKGASAHSINKALGRKGHVWQDESYDRVLRQSDSLEERTGYLRENPKRKGLVKTAEEWQWYWEEEQKATE